MDIIPFVTTWVIFEGIMLNEIHQAEKNNCCMMSPKSRIQKMLNSYKWRVEWWLPGSGE